MLFSMILYNVVIQTIVQWLRIWFYTLIKREMSTDLHQPQTQVKQRIMATVELIGANGVDFEQFLRNIHRQNPQYEFLKPSSRYYHYYLTQLAEALRPTVQATHHSGWTSQPETLQPKLEELPVGVMCEIVKEAVRRGMQPYTTLSRSDVAALLGQISNLCPHPYINQQNELLRFVEEEKALVKRQKDTKIAVKKAEDAALLEQGRKESRKTMDLPGKALTNEMGIGHDGSVEGSWSNKYQGLGRSQQTYGYDNYRRAQGRR